MRIGFVTGPRTVLTAPPALAGIALVLLSRLVLLRLVPGASEDAFITFRYARALAHGLGAFYNPGERVFGTTSPLWMAWTALGIRLGAGAAEWARGSAVVADVVTVVAATAMLGRHASRAGAWCFAVLFGAWPYFAAVAASGLETSATLALLTVAAWRIAERDDRAGWLLGALALSRPEGLACALVMAPWARGRARLVAALLVAAGVAVLAATYGNPIAQSVIAKARVYGAPGPLASRPWWDWIIPFDMGGWPTQGDTAQLWTLRILLAPAAAAGLVTIARTPLLPYALAGGSVWLAYILTGTAYFWWYLAIPAATAVTLAAAGMPKIVRGRWLYITTAAVVAGGWTYQPEFYAGRARTEARTFEPVAQYLRQAAHPGESVFLEPIGIIGWRNADLVVHDEIGLVTPWVAKRRTEGPGWYTDALDRYHPDWLVVRAGFLKHRAAFVGRGQPFRDSLEFVRTIRRYEVAYLTSQTPGEEDMAVLRRKK